MIKNDEVTITCWALIFPQSEPPPYDVCFLSTVIQRMSSTFHEWQIDTAAATWCDSADGNLAVKLAGYIGLCYLEVAVKLVQHLFPKKSLSDCEQHNWYGLATSASELLVWEKLLSTSGSYSWMVG